jgi:hypothetical protein
MFKPPLDHSRIRTIELESPSSSQVDFAASGIGRPSQQKQERHYGPKLKMSMFHIQ